MHVSVNELYRTVRWTTIDEDLSYRSQLCVVETGLIPGKHLYIFHACIH
jgi:hypothetical protein